MLVQLLSDTEAGSRSGAAITATHLAVSEAMREELLAAGTVPALVGCLGLQDSSVQTLAAEALAMMASDGTARMQVAGGGREEGGGRRGERERVHRKFLFHPVSVQRWCGCPPPSPPLHRPAAAWGSAVGRAGHSSEHGCGR